MLDGMFLHREKSPVSFIYLRNCHGIVVASFFFPFNPQHKMERCEGCEYKIEPLRRTPRHHFVTGVKNANEIRSIASGFTLGDSPRMARLSRSPNLAHL